MRVDAPSRVRRPAAELRDPQCTALAMDGNLAVSAATARYILLPLAQLITGYTVKAMQRKIERGDWQEGKVWRRAPDGRILIDVLGYQRWVEGQLRRA